MGKEKTRVGICKCVSCDHNYYIAPVCKLSHVRINEDGKCNSYRRRL